MLPYLAFAELTLLADLEDDETQHSRLVTVTLQMIQNK
jgi:hypothetical protein